MPRLIHAGLVAVLCSGAGLAVAPAYAEEPVACVFGVDVPVERHLSDGRGTLPGLLRLDEAHEIATGRGVTVAVVDSGVDVRPADPGYGSIAASDGPSLLPPKRLYDAHGTLVAGLIVGRSPEGTLGVAPDARVVSVRVLDASPEIADDEGLVHLQVENVVRGLEWVLVNHRAQGIRVVNLSLSFDEDVPQIAGLVRRLLDADVVVVAAAGSRVTGDAASPADAFRPGEDRVRFPANIPGVLGVAALGSDGTLDPETQLTGPGIDVAAPVEGAMTVNVGGTTCVLSAEASSGIGSSGAAAVVSGLAALVLEEFPRLDAREVVARIEATAQGALVDNALDGHGTVQPVAALTAELTFDKQGRVLQQPAHEPVKAEVTLPPPSRDEYAGPRRTLLWWGLGGGGALVMALLLRPLTGRRGG